MEKVQKEKLEEEEHKEEKPKEKNILTEIICNMCHGKLLEPGMTGQVREYGFKMYGCTKQNPRRGLNRSAIEIVPNCGHIVHLTCLNLRCSYAHAEFIEDEWVYDTNLPDPTSRCFCGMEIMSPTIRAHLSGYEEKEEDYILPQHPEPRDRLFVQGVHMDNLDESDDEDMEDDDDNAMDMEDDGDAMDVEENDDDDDVEEEDDGDEEEDEDIENDEIKMKNAMIKEVLNMEENDNENGEEEEDDDGDDQEEKENEAIDEESNEEEENKEADEDGSANEEAEDKNETELKKEDEDVDDDIQIVYMKLTRKRIQQLLFNTN